MDKLKGRIETLLFFFGFPTLMATANYMNWYGDWLVNGARYFWPVLYIWFAIESSVFVFIGVIAILWKEGDI